MFSTAEVQRLNNSLCKGAEPVKLQAFKTLWGKGRVNVWPEEDNFPVVLWVASDDPEILREEKLPVYPAMVLDNRIFRKVYYEYILRERERYHHICLSAGVLPNIQTLGIKMIRLCFFPSWSRCGEYDWHSFYTIITNRELSESQSLPGFAMCLQAVTALTWGIF